MPRRVRRIAIDDQHPDGGWEFNGLNYEVFGENVAFTSAFTQFDIGEPLLFGAAETSTVTLWNTGVVSIGPPTDEQVSFMAQLAAAPFGDDDAVQILKLFFPGEFLAFAWNAGGHSSYTYGINYVSGTESAEQNSIFIDIDDYQVGIGADGFYIQTSEYTGDWEPFPSLYSIEAGIGYADLTYMSYFDSGYEFDGYIDDTLEFSGSSDDDTISGTAFGDTINGYLGNDRLFGLEGNDMLTDNDGGDTLFGGRGDDTYFVAQGSATDIREDPGEGYDVVHSGGSFELREHVEELRLTGSGSSDGTGNSSSNYIYGNPGANLLRGREGDDVLVGKGGNDKLEGDKGKDRLEGGGGDDKLFGEGGNDLLLGYADNDLLNGGVGDDVLNGGGGDDLLFGGTGRDFLFGGAGADEFLFADATELSGNAGIADVILDFDASDVIRLRGIDADTTTGGDQNFSFIGTAAFSGVAGQLRYYTSGGNTYLQMDVNGDGAGDLYLRLNGQVTLDASDFIL